MRSFNIFLHFLSLLAETLPEDEGDDMERECIKKLMLQVSEIIEPLKTGSSLLHGICHDQSVYDDFDLAQPPIPTSVNRPLLLQLAFETLNINKEKKLPSDFNTNIDVLGVLDCQKNIARRLINCKDSTGATPLHYAASLRCPKIVKVRRQKLFSLSIIRDCLFLCRNYSKLVPIHPR